MRCFSITIDGSAFEIKKRIFDCVHGYIDLYEPEIEIIDTKLFQRLRGIVQLGLGSLVYPGATHTRFSHSLGVLHVISQMLHFLKIEPPSINEMRTFINDTQPTIPNKKKIPLEMDKFYFFTIRMAALLHDIGHFPFSHVFEPYFKIFEKHPHEAVSAEIINLDTIKGILEKYPDYNFDVEIMQAMIKGEPKAPIRYVQMLNSKIDADRIDYLLRDSYNCGLIYGKIDIDRILRNLALRQIKGFDDYAVVINNKANISVDQFLVSRYYMYNTVYYHKTTFCFEEILRKIVKKSGSLGNIPPRKYAWQDGDEDMRDQDQIKMELLDRFEEILRTNDYSAFTFNDIVLALLDRDRPETKRLLPDEIWDTIQKSEFEDQFCQYTDHFVWNSEYQNYLGIKKKKAAGDTLDTIEEDLLTLYEHLFNRDPVQLIFSAEELVIVKDNDFNAKLANLLDDIQIDDDILSYLKKPLVLTRILDEYPILDYVNRSSPEGTISRDEQDLSILKDIILLDNENPISIYDSNLSIMKILPEFKKFFLQVYSPKDIDVQDLKQLIKDKVKILG